MAMEQHLVRRRIVREKVVQALYAHEISGDPLDHVMSCTLTGLQDNPPAFEFARALVISAVAHALDIDKIIRAKVTNWDFKRIAVLDRLILRMGICELLYFKEIPPKVSMNEAIELAKLFSTERSGQFVNGVLDAVLNDIKDLGPDKLGEGGVAKAGRGLYDGDPAKRLAKVKPKLQ
jgi:transcription antitermination protein NusB